MVATQHFKREPPVFRTNGGVARRRIGRDRGAELEWLLRVSTRVLSTGGPMDRSLQTANPAYAGTAVSVDQRNRVLRNTYWLLALSMVPTVLGAWIGVSTGLMGAMGV